MNGYKEFEKVSLGIFPTPIQKLDNISRILGVQVYVKRDDMTGWDWAATRYASSNICLRRQRHRVLRSCLRPAALSQITPCSPHAHAASWA